MYFCKKDLNVLEVKFQSVPYCEVLALDFVSLKETIRAVVVYRPPDQDFGSFESLCPCLENLSSSCCGRFLLLGDFNLPKFDWVNVLPLSFDDFHVTFYEVFVECFLNHMFLSQLDGTTFSI